MLFGAFLIWLQIPHVFFFFSMVNGFNRQVYTQKQKNSRNGRPNYNGQEYACCGKKCIPVYTGIKKAGQYQKAQ